MLEKFNVASKDGKTLVNGVPVNSTSLGILAVNAAKAFLKRDACNYHQEQLNYFLGFLNVLDIAGAACSDDSLKTLFESVLEAYDEFGASNFVGLYVICWIKKFALREVRP